MKWKRVIFVLFDFLFRYDLREFDVVLREVVVMNVRAEMYLRFLEKRVIVSYLMYLSFFCFYFWCIFYYILGIDRWNNL